MIGMRSTSSLHSMPSLLHNLMKGRLFSSTSAAAASLTEAESMLRAQQLLANCTRVVALTGAGISTESGVPDYRSPGRPPHRPTSHQQFMASHQTRQRYWSRSMLGYQTLRESLPNAGHYALSVAEANRKVLGIITQNVDLLHEGAGSKHVLHLHGTVDHVRCMSCDAISSRVEFQAKLRSLNSSFLTPGGIEKIRHNKRPEDNSIYTSPPPPQNRVLRPDGDSDQSHISDYSAFIIPSCSSCTDGFGTGLESHSAFARHLPGQPAGILKPDLVFFGANVPKHVHAHADEMIQAADGLVVAGTSLTVWSAFRLIRHIVQRTVPGFAQSVLEVADQINKLKQQLDQNTVSSSGHNTISDGAAQLNPVTPLELDLTALSQMEGFPSRVPLALPIVIVNQGPTRADQYLHAASDGMIKVHSRTGEALHTLFGVDRNLTKEMERQARTKHFSEEDIIKQQQMLVENMKQHQNIE